MSLIKKCYTFGKLYVYTLGHVIGIPIEESKYESVVAQYVFEFKNWFGISILVLGRPMSGKSMLIRSLHGDYCHKSERQTKGEESIKSWTTTINGEKIKFAETSDYAGNRSFHECDGNSKSMVEEALKFVHRLFFVCNIEEYFNNLKDPNIGICVRDDILERLGQLAILKPKYTTLEIIFSYVDQLNENDREIAENHLKSQMSIDTFEGVKFYEVNFMDRESSTKLVNQLFAK